MLTVIICTIWGCIGMIIVGFCLGGIMEVFNKSLWAIPWAIFFSILAMYSVFLGMAVRAEWIKNNL